jgi:molybdopterin/thiamine biosynthesis adenylyltransferase
MFNFQPASIPNRIYVVGCGGTGSRLVPMLAQFIRSITREFNPRGWLNSTQIVLVDGDVVEQKNLLRQNFIAQDVGKNKASVIAARYSKAYGMNIVALPEFVKENDDYTSIRKNIPGYTHGVYSDEMVIMCVDSVSARRLIMKVLVPPNSNFKTLYIDAGNEDSFGQVRFFTNDVISAMSNMTSLKDVYKNPNRIEVQGTVNFIPYDADYYNNLKDNPGLGSCADLDQTLAINAIMATFILGIVQNFYYSKPMNYNEVSIDLKGSATFTYNTVSNFRNKIITPKHVDDYGRMNFGMKRGLIGVSNLHTVEFLDNYIYENGIAVQRVLEQQAAEGIMPSLGSTEIQGDVQAKKKRTKRENTLAEALTGVSGFSRLTIAEQEIAAYATPVDPVVGLVEEVEEEVEDDGVHEDSEL